MSNSYIFNEKYSEFIVKYALTSFKDYNDPISNKESE